MQDGVNGRLVPDTASDEHWAQVLMDLLKDPSERERLAANALAVRDLYAPEALQRRLVQALERVVSEAAAN
jgi:Trp operon repressor